MEYMNLRWPPKGDNRMHVSYHVTQAVPDKNGLSLACVHMRHHTFCLSLFLLPTLVLVFGAPDRLSRYVGMVFAACQRVV